MCTVTISLKEKEEKMDKKANGMAFDFCLTINSLVIQQENSSNNTHKAPVE